MDASARHSVERDDSCWLSTRARTAIWWMLVTFAILDWTHPQVALTQEWWCVLLVLWIVPWERLTNAPSAIRRFASWISSIVLFAWLVTRTEHAVRESVSTWLLFRWSPESKLFSYPWHATIAAFVTSLVIVSPLRRLVGEAVAKPTAVLICLPYSLGLAAHLFSLVQKPLAVGIALYAVAIPALTMAAVLWFLRLFQPGGDRIAAYRSGGTWGYRILTGQLSSCGAVLVLYAGTLALTLWLTTSWVLRGVPLPVRAPGSLLDAFAFPWVLSGLVLSSLALWRRLDHEKPRNVIAENLRTLARGLVLVTLVPALLTGFFLGLPYSAEVISDTVQESGGPAWSVTPSDTGQEIRITGEIGPGLSDALAEVLETTPGVERLALESPGGSVREGRALAELVQKHSLDTAVTTYCDSACTLVFVAGRERVLENGAELGFHRCRSTLWFYALLYDDEHNAEMARYLQSKGISKAFADEVISVSSNNLWYPSTDQLLAAGVTTSAATPDAETETLRSP